MIQLISIFIPIAFTDVMNPVLLAAVVFTLGSKKPIVNSILLLLAYFLTYFIAGIILAIALDKIISFLQNPRPVDFIIEAIIGIFILILGIRSLRPPRPKRKEPQHKEVDTFGSWAAILLGVQVNILGLPFALPYFAAIDQILKADLSVGLSVISLVIYNVFYIFPFFALVLIRIVLREKSDLIFQKINERMERISNFLVPILLLALGSALIADSIYYFINGQPLF